jgi:hypothetical protein
MSRTSQLSLGVALLLLVCGDAVRSLLRYGHADNARKMVGALLDFNRRATRFHVAGHKLQLLAHYYWLTRDARYLRDKELGWKAVVEFITTSRQKENGFGVEAAPAGR